MGLRSRLKHSHRFVSASFSGYTFCNHVSSGAPLCVAQIFQPDFPCRAGFFFIKTDNAYRAHKSIPLALYKKNAEWIQYTIRRFLFMNRNVENYFSAVSVCDILQLAVAGAGNDIILLLGSQVDKAHGIS